MTGGERLSITLGGNAAVLIRAGSRAVLTDPWLSGSIGPWKRLRPPGLDPAALPPLDALLISHAHPDHLDPRSLALLEKSTPAASPGGAPHRRLRALGFRARALREWETWDPAGEPASLRITAVPAVHTRWCLGFVVHAAGRRLYFAGDVGPSTGFGEIAARCGPLDAALLPVGGSSLALGPLQRHLTPEAAARAAGELGVRCVVPIHWGHVPCVPAALDRFRGTADLFAAAMRRAAPQVTVLLPREGEECPLP